MKFLLFLLALTLVSCYDTERDCTSFKSGKYRFESEVNGQKLVSTFERKGDLEIENYNGKIDTSSIRWVGDCEYILTKLHPQNRNEARGVAIKIMTTTKDSYEFEFGEVGNGKKFKGKATRIN